MNKRMRELQAQMAETQERVKGFMADGEGKDLDKAAAELDKLDELKAEYAIEKRAAEAAKETFEVEKKPDAAGKVDGFALMGKLMRRSTLNEREKAALLTGEGAQNGENYLLPEDVQLEINEFRKTYVSAKDIVTVEHTTALSGSVNWEAGVPSGLVDFEDGEAIGEDAGPEFTRKQYTIGWKGKLIPVSRILQGAERAGLMGYLDRWFVKNAIISENTDIFAQLKTGYNSGAPKAVAGWKALKKSINVDLDPAALIGGFIVTNQSGFACLDEETDENGRPILQQNPANATEKVFQGMPVKVFPDSILPNIDGTHFPIFYGNTKAGCIFKEYKALEFAVSEHFYFNKNQTCLRVIEGYDVMEGDTTAYIYGSLTATPAA